MNASMFRRGIERLPRVLNRRLARLLLSGTQRECPICGETSRRFARGPSRRPDARCAACGSLERHRLAWLYLAACTEIFTRPLRVLHVAPERCIAERLEATPGLRHLTADLGADGVDVRVDIQALPFAGALFDVIYCSHVLEHVNDDGAALRELRRVLRPGGWVLVQVPIDDRDRTFDDPSVRSPAERERLFGQVDHVRAYGRDAAERFRRFGFQVEVVRFGRTLAPEQVRRYGVNRDEPLFICGRADD